MEHKLLPDKGEEVVNNNTGLGLKELIFTYISLALTTLAGKIKIFGGKASLKLENKALLIFKIVLSRNCATF